MMYIHPDECINCGLCLSVCPVDAIFAEEDLPETENAYLQINAEFFSQSVTGWGSPGGANERYRTDKDHADVASRPKSRTSSETG
jgi:ferredoxin